MQRNLNILNVRYGLLLVIVTLISISCNQDKKPVTVTQNELDGSVDLNITNEVSEVKFSDGKTLEIYGLYLNIKAALVNSNSEGVQVEAKKLEAAIGVLEEYKSLKATSKLISLTKDIKEQRNFFVSLTNETEKLIHDAKITSGAVYKQFCPMAFDGEGGYWLSDSEEIRNPFFGDKMLVCGSVKDVFK
ncbi:DUF3347 domain-containing protein [Aquimarina algiphila]|uniref:DUF3347 domain-containing protein n=1 Tax=Aquimarina algiphila TaxID=2047982 RepID=A0A554VK78_9FLAO|nr:DUF3347 domain-containing protein [Aquimarina algiphila]TSE08380.1 DUF3347 domain-containing protein [Aquimarina algiphila]